MSYRQAEQTTQAVVENKTAATDKEKVVQRDTAVSATASLGGDPDTQAAHLNQQTNGRLSRASDTLLQLQNQYGNQHVQQIINPQQRLTVQPKLMLGDVDTPSEREADQIASQAVSDGQITSTPTPVSGATIPVAPETESAINQARGSGQPLPESTQTQMSQSLGTDLSGVRIHTDSRADSLNQSLQARAFTTGKDIFFRQGAYQPGNSAGQSLLTHELAHVAQQSGSTSNVAQSKRFIQRDIKVGTTTFKHENINEDLFNRLIGEQQLILTNDEEMENAKLVLSILSERSFVTSDLPTLGKIIKEILQQASRQLKIIKTPPTTDWKMNLLRETTKGFFNNYSAPKTSQKNKKKVKSKANDNKQNQIPESSPNIKSSASKPIVSNNNNNVAPAQPVNNNIAQINQPAATPYDADKLQQSMADLQLRGIKYNKPGLTAAERHLWKRGGPDPLELNCWQTVLYAALQAGIIDEEYMKLADRAIRIRAAEDQRNVLSQAIWRRSGANKIEWKGKGLEIQKWVYGELNKKNIPKGYVIIIGQIGKHVALSTGRRKVAESQNQMNKLGIVSDDHQAHEMYENDDQKSASLSSDIMRTTLEDRLNETYIETINEIAWGPLPSKEELEFEYQQLLREQKQTQVSDLMVKLGEELSGTKEELYEEAVKQFEAGLKEEKEKYEAGIKAQKFTLKNRRKREAKLKKTKTMRNLKNEKKKEGKKKKIERSQTSRHLPKNTKKPDQSATNLTKNQPKSQEQIEWEAREQLRMRMEIERQRLQEIYRPAQEEKDRENKRFLLEEEREERELKELIDMMGLDEPLFQGNQVQSQQQLPQESSVANVDAPTDTGLINVEEPKQQPIILNMQDLLIGPGHIDLSPPAPSQGTAQYNGKIPQPRANLANAAPGPSPNKEVNTSSKQVKSSKKNSSPVSQQSKADRLRVIVHKTFLYNDGKKSFTKTSFTIPRNSFVYVTGRTARRKSGLWVEINYYSTTDQVWITGWVMSELLRQIADKKEAF